MTNGTPEQRNKYKGDPPRPWIRLRLTAVDGTSQDVELMADTGNPFALIIGEALMLRVKQGDAPDADTNFGRLTGGWLFVAVPEWSQEQLLLGYASEDVVAAAKGSCPDFEGLVGLPFLRLAHYGGDAEDFWIRPARISP